MNTKEQDGRLLAEKDAEIARLVQAIADHATVRAEQHAEIERLRKGEFICQRCGLRKNDTHPKTHDF